MDTKLDKLNKRVHVREQGINITEEKEAKTERSVSWERMLIFWEGGAEKLETIVLMLEVFELEGME